MVHADKKRARLMIAVPILIILAGLVAILLMCATSASVRSSSLAHLMAMVRRPDSCPADSPRPPYS